MADIFHEVDEEVRREQLKKLWDRYSIYLIAAAVLIVLAIAAWRGYEYWVAKRAATAGAAYEAAASLIEQTNMPRRTLRSPKWRPTRRKAIASWPACAGREHSPRSSPPRQ